MPPWLQSIFDAVVANIVSHLVIFVVGGLILGGLSLFVFGRGYKERIAALEARPSQTVNQHFYYGEKSATELAGAGVGFRTVPSFRSDAPDDDPPDNEEVSFMRKPPQVHDLGVREPAPEIYGDSALPVTEILALSQAQYDALPTKSESTLYVITDSRHPKSG